MKRLFKILAWTFGALVLLMVIAAVTLILVFDPNDYRDEIGALVKRQTGRDLIITGNLELSVFPWLGVDVGETQLSNAPGFGPAPFARIAHAKVNVRLLPLLRREVELDEVELAGLRLHLARDRTGRNNWDVLTRAGEPRAPEAPPAPKEKRGLAAFRLGGLAIRDAQVNWEDKAQDQQAQVANLSLRTGALDLAAPVDLTLDADFALNAPQVAGHVTLKGRLHHDQAAQRYGVEGLTLDLMARGAAVPGGELKAAVGGDASADLKAQTADIKGLRAEAYGTRLQLTGAAQQILDEPAAKGQLEMHVTDAKALADALAGHLPLGVEPKAFAGARLASGFEVSMARGTANLPDLRVHAFGVDLNARLEARQLRQKPAAKGSARIQIKDGDVLLRPFAKSLPQGFKPAALTGALLESAFDADLATERLTLSGTQLKALGLQLRTDAQGTQILSKPAFQGTLAVSEFVPRDLLATLGITLPAMADPSTLAKAALTARFDAGVDHAGLHDMVLRVDQSTLKGRASAQRFTPLVLRYDLTVDRIDADRYLPPPSPAKEQPPAATKAATAPLQWPLEQLRAVDIDGTLRVGQLKAANLRSAEIVATLRAQGGQLRLHPLGAKLYEGVYAGNLGLDVRSATPLLSMDERLTAVQVGPLLKDFMGKDYVTGKAQLAAALTARGTDFLQIRQSLNGQASFVFENGVVKGLNIGQLLREGYAVYKGEPKPKEETRQTDFTELRGSVTVKDGLVSNNDLSAKSPLFRVTGEGTAHLVSEKVNYRVNAAVVSSFEGQGGRELADLRGLTVPVQITGTFSDPKFGVAIGDVLESRARQALEEEKQKLQQRLEEETKRREAEARQQLERALEEKLKDSFKLP